MSKTDDAGVGRHDGVVDIIGHHFGVAGSSEWPGVHSPTVTGFLDEVWHGVLVYTGIESGPVRVIVDARADPPDHVDDGSDWDEIAEASVAVAAGETLQVVQPYVDPPELPPLSGSGPASYRLRAHGWGRDLHTEESWDGDPVEVYLLQAWPAPPAPLEVSRRRDRYGADRRATAARSGRPMKPPRPWDDRDDSGGFEDAEDRADPY